jgi:hypothetical protein
MIIMRSTISKAMFHRQGSAYVLVLGVALLLTVIGMGTLLTTRLAGKQSGNATDWQQSGLIAQSMVEQAMSYLNAQIAANPAGWRSSFTSYTSGGAVAFSQTTSIGAGSWVVKDQVDGNFANNYADPFQLYGIGKVGQTTRVYSVQVVPAGSPMDVLRCGLHAGGSINTSGTITLGAGPISSNGNIKTQANISGNLEAQSQNGTAGNVHGFLTVPAAIKPMPSPGLYNIYLAKATAIPWSTLGSGINNQLLTSTSNSFGPTNPDGVYSIVVPSGQNFTISSSRIKGTLVISMAGGCTLNITGPILWEPSRTDYPILIVQGTNVTVNITGSNTWLSESTVGLDLNGNGTTTDDLPPQYRGLIHIIGATNSVQLSNNAYILGLLVTDGAVTTNNQTSFISDPNLYANPPLGYGKGDQLMIVPGSWIWDSPP